MPRSRVEKRPQAIRDLADAAAYLAEESRSDELAFRFLDAAEASLEDIAAMPEMGTQRPCNDDTLSDLRTWRVRGFPSYLIFYLPIDSGIEVVRVLHGRRDIESLFGRAVE